MSIFRSNVKRLPEEEVRALIEQARYSPDLGYLEQFDYMLLFCPDDLRSTCLNHKLIEESAFMATAYTRKNFNYWVQTVGDSRTPIPMEATGTQLVRYFPPPLKVKGELNLVSTHQFKDVDTEKRNGVQFQRKRVDLIVPFRGLIYKENVDEDPTRAIPDCLRGKEIPILQPERVAIVRAWMYVAKPEYWNDVLDAGFSRAFQTCNIYKSRRSWLNEYYSYPRRKLGE